MAYPNFGIWARRAVATLVFVASAPSIASAQPTSRGLGVGVESRFQRGVQVGPQIRKPLGIAGGVIDYDFGAAILRSTRAANPPAWRSPGAAWDGRTARTVLLLDASGGLRFGERRNWRLLVSGGVSITEWGVGVFVPAHDTVPPPPFVEPVGQLDASPFISLGLATSFRLRGRPFELELRVDETYDAVHETAGFRLIARRRW